MFRSQRTKRFKALFEKLPSDAQSQTAETYKLFKKDPRHGSLQFKCVDESENPPVYSIRIGAHYRALGYLEGDMVTWYWIGTHEAYNKIV